MSKFEKVKRFHQAFNLPVKDTAGFPDEDERNLRIKLLAEEFKEYRDAEEDDDFVEVCDALGDMLYIIYGTCLSYGIPIDNIFDEIHRSNMTKLDENGKAIYREDGKVVKSHLFTPPNIKAILEGNDV